MTSTKIDDDDRDALRTSQNTINQAQLALQRATLEHEELKQRMVEKYQLHPADRVMGDGQIERGT